MIEIIYNGRMYEDSFIKWFQNSEFLVLYTKISSLKSVETTEIWLGSGLPYQVKGEWFNECLKIIESCYSLSFDPENDRRMKEACWKIFHLLKEEYHKLNHQYESILRWYKPILKGRIKKNITPTVSKIIEPQYRLL